MVNPFYQVNPKPSAMNDTIEYVLKNSKNKTIAIDRGDLDLPKIASDPWTPIWTNLLFIGFMLILLRKISRIARTSGRGYRRHLSSKNELG